MLLVRRLKNRLLFRLCEAVARLNEVSEVVLATATGEPSVCLRLFPAHDRVFRDADCRGFDQDFARLMRESGFDVRFSGQKRCYFGRLLCGLVTIELLIEGSGPGDVCALTLKAGVALDEEFWAGEVRYGTSSLEDGDLPADKVDDALAFLPELSPREASSAMLVQAVYDSLRGILYGAARLPNVIVTRGDFEEHVVDGHGVAIGEIYEAYLQQTAEPVTSDKDKNQDGLGRIKKMFLGIASSSGRMIQPVMRIEDAGGRNVLITAWDILEPDNRASLLFWMAPGRVRWRIAEGGRFALYAKASLAARSRW